IEGKEIIEYNDIVNGEAIMGANIVRNLFASVRDVDGGRSGAYESKLKEARDIAMEEMKPLARKKNANAIVGIDVDY
ncbi:heavy metal-binding domain-containing protein, partial [Bacillus paranthracis]|nr:heavy metal-binding domain-containing protein [Bacillus paranthracis]